MIVVLLFAWLRIAFSFMKNMCSVLSSKSTGSNGRNLPALCSQPVLATEGEREEGSKGNGTRMGRKGGARGDGAGGRAGGAAASLVLEEEVQ